MLLTTITSNEGVGGRELADDWLHRIALPAGALLTAEQCEAFSVRLSRAGSVLSYQLDAELVPGPAEEDKPTLWLYANKPANPWLAELVQRTLAETIPNEPIDYEIDGVGFRRTPAGVIEYRQVEDVVIVRDE